MGSLDNSIGKNNSKSVYDITNKIEEELTYIYEMRMKQTINASEKQENVSGKSNPNQSNILSGKVVTSIFAR